MSAWNLRISWNMCERTNVREKLIHEEKAGRSNLAVTWLDLPNACASISLALIKITLSSSHIPEKIQSHTGKDFSFLYSFPWLTDTGVTWKKNLILQTFRNLKQKLNR